MTSDGTDGSIDQRKGENFPERDASLFGSKALAKHPHPYFPAEDHRKRENGGRSKV